MAKKLKHGKEDNMARDYDRNRIHSISIPKGSDLARRIVADAKQSGMVGSIPKMLQLRLEEYYRMRDQLVALGQPLPVQPVLTQPSQARLMDVEDELEDETEEVSEAQDGEDSMAEAWLDL